MGQQGDGGNEASAAFGRNLVNHETVSFAVCVLPYLFEHTYHPYPLRATRDIPGNLVQLHGYIYPFVSIHRIWTS